MIVELQKEVESLEASLEEKDVCINTLEERIELLVSEMDSLKISKEKMAKNHQD
jgi:uncharacterized small protein (DUF1192 family)